MIFYFTGTGNSLYAAKQLDTEVVSIPQARYHNSHIRLTEIVSANDQHPELYKPRGI